MINPQSVFTSQQHLIGKTDNLSNITASINNYKSISFTQSLPSNRTNNSLKKQHLHKKSNYQSKEQFNKNIKAMKNSKKQHHFWPNDIINNESGQTMKCLKSYLQSGKVNSYIKLHLSKLQKSKVIKQLFSIIENIVYKIKKQHFHSLKQILTHSHSKTTKKPTTQNNNINNPQTLSKKITRINYQIINLSKSKNKNQLSSQTTYKNQTSKNQYNHNRQDFYQPKYQACSNMKQYIQNRQNRYKHCSSIAEKPPHMCYKRYLTPNTQTYLGQINPINSISSPRYRQDKKIKITQNMEQFQNYQSQINSPKIYTQKKNINNNQHLNYSTSITSKNNYQYFHGDHECFNYNHKQYSQNMNRVNKDHSTDRHNYSQILEVGNNIVMEGSYPEKRIKCGRQKRPEHYRIAHQFNYI